MSTSAKGVGVMKAVSRHVALATLLVILAGVAQADAHMRTHLWVGPVFGPTLWGPGFYSPPRTVIIERSPNVYLQAAPEAGSASWYYCKNAKAYYPYVKQCPGGWTKVDPTPPEEGE